MIRIKLINNLVFFFSLIFIPVFPVAANTQTLKGTVIKQPFINKIGEAVKNHDDYFFRMDSKNYFIKFCESKVTKAQIEPLVNKTITADVNVISSDTGLWDSCGPEEAQSRTGEYITILKIIP